MLRFEDFRIKQTNLDSVNFKNPIPIVYVEPKCENNKTVVFVFNGGIGSSNSSCVYMNSLLYDNHYFVSYEKAGHGKNCNKPSQFKTAYLNELEEVILGTRKKFPGKKIFLLGESGGASINFLYYKTNHNKVDGTVGGNMPLGIVNPERKTAKQMYSIVWREILTLLFNVECFLPIVQTSQDKFSRDPIFRRMLAIVPDSKRNTKINLSIGRFMKPCNRFIKKYGSNRKFKFLYIQSAEDVLADGKKIKKIEQYVDEQHYVKFDTGYHVLSMEPIESKELFKKILEFIK